MNTIIIFSVKNEQILSNISEKYKSHLENDDVVKIKNILIKNNYNFDFDICRNITGVTQPFLVAHDLNLEVSDFISFCDESGINKLLDSGKN